MLHFVAGLEAGAMQALQNGIPVDTLIVSASNTLVFEAGDRGEFLVMNLLVEPCPDLTVLAVETLPLTPACGDSVSVRALIKNLGQVAAGAFRVTTKLDGAQRCYSSFPQLAPGGEAWTPWCRLGLVSEGTHDLSICADSQGLVEEGNESNNCR